MEIGVEEIKKVVENFDVKGSSFSSRKFGNGHINDSYLIEDNSDGAEKFILRKINKYVFKNPDAVVNNSVKAVNHIREKLLAEGVKNYYDFLLTFIQTKTGGFAFVDKNSDYWCLTKFFADSYTVDFVETEKQAYEAAKAFGKFQKQLADADPNEFEIVIPDFHNLSKRISAYEKAAENASDERKEKAAEEMKTVDDFFRIVEKNNSLNESLSIPLRITHNDTKINNVMLDNKTDAAHCVIDLDTVMPGSVLSDFGDMVRTFTSPAEEDERDVSKVKMRLNIFKSLAAGYLEEMNGILTPSEKENLVFGAEMIVYEQAVRFLTDFFNNDMYYKTEYPEHNLVRTKNQFALLKSITEQSGEMEKIVTSLSAN